MPRLISFLITLVVVLSVYHNAHGQEVDFEGKYKGIYRIPWDGKPHEIQTNSKNTRAFALMGGVMNGAGAFRKDGVLEGESTFYVLGNVMLINNAIKRQVVLGIFVQPKTAPSKGGGDPIDYSLYRKLEVKVDDMLRVGRNLRDAGVEKEEKRIDFENIEDFKMSVFKGANTANILFFIEHQKKQIIFAGNLVQLSYFSDTVKKIGRWLFQQEDASLFSKSPRRYSGKKTKKR